ncbi:hypothetical protein [Spongiimicrobium sp. 3-5]|uniref:hypothetical protein n=1 Tax=Spongiimicrobium sp. 3-5 TaxID=3332596 RepID=UPI003980C955
MMVVKKRYKYLEWLNAQEMHDACTLWLSQLKFARDEQRFLNNLIKSHTLQLIDASVLEQSKETVDALLRKEKELVSLMKQVQLHGNQTVIMVDEVDQLKMEKAHIETHKDLTYLMERYMAQYNHLKEKIFKLVSHVMKKEKQKRLLK